MWEDTVMDEGRMLGCSLRGTYGFDAVKDVILDTAIAQAEITGKIMYDEGFKAGKELRRLDFAEEVGLAMVESCKVGQRDVVEWIRKANKSGDFYYSFDQAELEAKLKEWGIK